MATTTSATETIDAVRQFAMGAPLNRGRDTAARSATKDL
jgi:hypothetical protein